MIAYLDMDGVLVDFVGGACRAFDVSREDLYKVWPPGKFDFHEELGLTPNQFWKALDLIGPAFWANLDRTPEFAAILDFCKSNFSGTVLCTSPSANPDVSGKILWIKKHVPELRRKFAITPCKEEFAHPGAVLIDDKDSNIDKFHERGGAVIRFPRRWNRLHAYADDPMAWIRRMV